MYELTEQGAELEPILIELGRWGRHRPMPSDDAKMSADAFILALKTTFDPIAAGDLQASVDLRLDDDRFTVRSRRVASPSRARAPRTRMRRSTRIWTPSATSRSAAAASMTPRRRAPSA